MRERTSYVKAMTAETRERTANGQSGRVVSRWRGWALLCDHTDHEGFTVGGFTTRREALGARDSHDANYH